MTIAYDPRTALASLTPSATVAALAKVEAQWLRSLTSPEAAYAARYDAFGAEVGKAIERLLASEERADGWQNLLTGIGTSRDKVGAGLFACDGQLSFSELEDLFHNDDMGARICDAVPAHCWREGYELDADGDHELSQEIEEALNDLGMADKFEEAATWGRLYGGAKVLVGADDGQDASKPLNEERIKRVDFLQVLDRYSLFPWQFYTDPRKAKFGEPEVYRIIQPIVVGAGTTQGIQFQVGAEVHESRLIHFGGSRTSIRKRRFNLGWDDSVLQRCYQVLRAYGVQWASITHLLSDASQGVMKLKGLADMIVGGNKELLQERMRVVDMARSNARAILLDADTEDFARVGTPFSGIPELTDRLTQRLAAAARTPVTILMGEAPAGLNATGDSDLRNFYDEIAGIQRRTETPRVRRLAKLVCAAKQGPFSGKVPEKLNVTFNSLWQLTPLEEATRRKTIAETDAIYITNSVVTAEETGESRFGDRGYSPETHIDLDLRAELKDADAQATQLAGGKPDPVQVAGDTAAAVALATAPKEGDPEEAPAKAKPKKAA